MDARVKLIVAIAAILASLFSTRAGPAAGHAGRFAGLVGGFRRPWRTVLLRLTAPLGLVLVVAVLRAVLTGATPLWSLRLGPWTLVVSREGAAEGALLAVRVLGSVGVLVVIATFTHAHEIFAALRWMRFPRTWIEIATLMVRSIFTLFEQAASVLVGAAGPARPRHLPPHARFGRPAGGHRPLAVDRAGGADPRGDDRPRLPGLPAGNPPSAADEKRRRVVRRVRSGSLRPRWRRKGSSCDRRGQSELPAIEAERIGYAYPDGVPALEDISFHAAKGEFVAVMGANGAGKTTLMKALMRLVRPQRGQIRLSGVDAATAAARRNCTARSAWSFRIPRISSSPRRSSRTWPSGRGTWGWPRPRSPGASTRPWRPSTRRRCEAARSITSVSASRSGRAWRGCWRCGLRSSSSTSRPPASTRSAKPT